MKFFVEITLLPSPEIPLNFLWEKVYGQVHLALVERQDGEGKVAIGAAFPGYDACQFQLGCKLRLFGEDKTDLEKLNLSKWLNRLSDYAHVTGIREVPEKCRYGVFRRLQPQSSIPRLARRKAKRHGISFEEAMDLLKNRKEQISKAPYIWCKSLSSDKRYRLLVDSVVMDQSRPGSFSTYGLSSTSTVPLF